MDKKWVLYILQCKDQSLYTGITKDLEKRLKMHREGNGAKYTCGRAPLILRYCEECENHSQALRREMELKKLTRKEKLALCNIDPREDI